jgi:hypothetical protein
MQTVMDRLYLELANVVSPETRSSRELALEQQIKDLREVLLAIDNTAVLIASGKTLKEYSIPGEVLKRVEAVLRASVQTHK